MAEARATVRQRRRISRIWLVPLVAVALGAWMVVYTWQTEGPEIEIVFSTAEGIEAGKTKVKARSVEVGVVERVVLGQSDATFEVMIRIVLRKSTVRPLPSVIRPSSRTCSRTLNTSGWAFSISSNSTTA